MSIMLVAAFVIASCSQRYKLNYLVDYETDEANRQCFYKPKFTSGERMKNYPFNVASQVVLTSYNGGLGGKEPGSPDLERVVLRKTQIDSLTDVLYNNFYKGDFLNMNGVGCFEPNNAIVFLDASGREFERADVCFQCLNFETKPTEFQLGDDCYWKIRLLDSFFISCGIKHGPQSNRPKEER